MSIPEEINANEFDEQTHYGEGEEDPAMDAGDTLYGAPEDIPQTLEERILELEEEVLELKDKLLRSLADRENIRKRAEREKAATRIYAIEKFAGDLIAVGDNLERAKMSLSADMRAQMGDAGKALSEGVDMTLTALNDTLSRHNVVPINAEPGSIFDPNLHQAVSQIPSEHASGSIAVTFQPGWQIGERTLRAAMVAVSAGQPAAATQTAATQTAADESDVSSHSHPNSMVDPKE